MTSNDLRAKRAAAGITGQAVSQITGIPRTKLCDIERGYTVATPDDLLRINDAIEQILQTRRGLTKLAEDAGMALTGIRL